MIRARDNDRIFSPLKKKKKAEVDKSPSQVLKFILLLTWIVSDGVWEPEVDGKS